MSPGTAQSFLSPCAHAEVAEQQIQQQGRGQNSFFPTSLRPRFKLKRNKTIINKTRILRDSKFNTATFGSRPAAPFAIPDFSAVSGPNPKLPVGRQQTKERPFARPPTANRGRNPSEPPQPSAQHGGPHPRPRSSPVRFPARHPHFPRSSPSPPPPQRYARR